MSRSPLVSLCVLALVCLFAAPHAHTSEPVILVYGDSISAGYGMQADESWVALLERRLNEKRYPHRVVNASVSGETTGGGVVRLDEALAYHDPALVVLELGGNDGLRGYPVSKIRANLEKMARQIIDSGADVLLIGMVLPPNYGRRYTQAFEQAYADVAEATGAALVPYLLEGTTTDRSLLQRDGIHPTSEAQALLMDDVWPSIENWLNRPTTADASITSAPP